MDSVWFNNGSVRLHARIDGPEGAPVLFLLHGFPEFWYGWRNQISPLATAGFRVIALDQRGYNLSDKPRGVGSYRIEKLAADILSVADSLGTKTFHVVGHDWGGVVGWWLGSMYPDRVRRLAILNVPHPKAYREHLRSHPSQWVRSSYIGWFQVPLLPEWTLSAFRFGTLERAMLGSAHRGAFNEGELFAYREAWSQPGALTSMLNWYRAAAWERWPDTGPVTVPTLILWGRQDKFLNAELAEQSLRFCERGRLISYTDATHWIHLEIPDKVNRELIEFFRESTEDVGR